MPTIYEPSPPQGALEQCEILRDVVENRPLLAAVEPPRATPIQVQPLRHHWLVVMTNACDLLWDYETRQSIPEEEKQEDDWERSYPRITPHVLVCEALGESEIKGLHQLNTGRLKRIQKNQEERLHYVQGAAVESSHGSLPDLYLDFKKAFSLPTQSVYDGIDAKGIYRVAVLAGDYRYDLMHRFFGFLSRVGIP